MVKGLNSEKNKYWSGPSGYNAFIKDEYQTDHSLSNIIGRCDVSSTMCPM